MTTLSLLDAIERPAILGFDRDGHQYDARRAGGAPTLDELLTGTWDALVSGRAATCPMCEGLLEPRYAAAHAPVAGRCARCGTEID